MEKDVTEGMRHVIRGCEEDQDYELKERLTHAMERQYSVMKDLAGKTTTLSKISNQNKALGQFLFDKELMV